jgi:threonine/homoserine/homoserine lactone efflux protein
MQDPFLFTLAVLAILGTPGPTNTLLAVAGATSGWRCALKLIPAEMAGYGAAILVLGLLLGPAVAGQSWLAAGLRLGVGAYLLWLAWGLWRRGAPALDGPGLIRPRQVFVTTLLNPKAIVLALGVIPFGTARVWPYMLGFLALLAAVASCWIMAGALLGRGAGTLVPRLGAVVIGGFAVLLASGPLLG